MRTFTLMSMLSLEQRFELSILSCDVVDPSSFISCPESPMHGELHLQWSCGIASRHHGYLVFWFQRADSTIEPLPHPYAARNVSYAVRVSGYRIKA